MQAAANAAQFATVGDWVANLINAEVHHFEFDETEAKAMADRQAATERYNQRLVNFETDYKPITAKIVENRTDT